MVKAIFILVFLVNITNCSPTLKSNSLFITSLDSLQKIPSQENESFDTFFKKFSSDSIFQLCRIRFPLSYYVVDIMDNEEEFILLTKDWLFEDFINDHDAMKSKYDQFEGIVLKISNIEYKYVRKGIDNGIKIEYYFELEIEDCRWFLVKIINSST
jgi:hypothetical protein